MMVIIRSFIRRLSMIMRSTNQTSKVHILCKIIIYFTRYFIRIWKLYIFLIFICVTICWRRVIEREDWIKNLINLVLILYLWLLTFRFFLFDKIIWISDWIVLNYIRFIHLAIKILINWVPWTSLSSRSIKLSNFRLVVFLSATSTLHSGIINKSNFLILELYYYGFIYYYGCLIITPVLWLTIYGS